jgi:hypothetical protein
MTALLRVLVLQGAPPNEIMVRRLLQEHTVVVYEGARLRARLPEYLAQRKTLLSENCAIIPPLLALISSYEELTTIEEI